LRLGPPTGAEVEDGLGVGVELELRDVKVATQGHW
jgi:hypothetical protein